MALIYGSNTKILFAGSIIKTLGAVSNNIWGPTITIGVTVYQGTAPLPSAITASWATYNSSTTDYLVHFTNAIWSLPGTGPLIQLSTAPTPVNAVRSGTAAWAILWAGQPSGAQLASVTLPFANFLVVSVSDAVGDGVIRFTSTTLTSGVSASVLDASMATNL
jgi:hypothetical protein